MKDKEQKKINEAFAMSLINENADALKEICEVGIDMVFEDGSLLEQIPIINVGVSLCKTTISIRDRILFNNVITFIKEFNDGTISKDNFEKHKQVINDEKKFNQEIEFVIRYIDLCSDNEHATLLAKFYRSYILDKINWDQFRELSEANRRMFSTDCALLKQIGFLGKLTSISEEEESHVNRLYSLGLVIDERMHSYLETALQDELDVSYKDKDGVVLTKLGKLFCKYLDITIEDAFGPPFIL